MRERKRIVRVAALLCAVIFWKGTFVLFAAESEGPVGVQNVDVVRATGLLGAKETVVILDVRTPGEFDAGHLSGAVNIDIDDTAFRERVRGLPRDQPYLVHCAAGIPRVAVVGPSLSYKGWVSRRSITSTVASMPGRLAAARWKPVLRAPPKAEGAPWLVAPAPILRGLRTLRGSSGPGELEASGTRGLQPSRVEMAIEAYESLLSFGQ